MIKKSTGWLIRALHSPHYWGLLTNQISPFTTLLKGLLTNQSSPFAALLRIADQSEHSNRHTIEVCWPIQALHSPPYYELLTNQSSPFDALLRIADQSEHSIRHTIEVWWPIQALHSPHYYELLDCRPIRALHSPHCWRLLTNQSSQFAPVLRIVGQSELSIRPTLDNCWPIRILHSLHY